MKPKFKVGDKVIFSYEEYAPARYKIKKVNERNYKLQRIGEKETWESVEFDEFDKYARLITKLEQALK